MIRLALLAAVALAVPAAAAPAAVAPPTVRVNGKDVPAAAAVRLKAGDRLETGTSAASVATSGGDAVRIEPGSILTHQGIEHGVEYLFVVAGAAEGPVGDATSIGAPAAWVTAAPRESASVRVTVRPQTDPARREESVVRTVRGAAVLRYHAVTAVLSAGCEVRLVPSAAGPGSLALEAPATNPGDVDVRRAAGAFTHSLRLPPGAAGFLADRLGATRVECARAARGRPVRVSVRSGDRVLRSGSLSGGAVATFDRDALTVDVPAVGDGRIAALLAQAAEFAPLEAR